ncbi:MAG: hypothetical protein ACI4C1_09105 [Lachnospiraceae bacterium]
MKTLRIAIAAFFTLTVIGYMFYSVNDAKKQDNIAPEIQCAEDTIEAGVAVSEEELLAGMTATDDKDGDVTDSLLVVSKSKFTEKGKRKVNYAAFDSHNNVSTYSRTLIYTDYVSPQFTLSEPLRYSVGTLEYGLLSKLSAFDCIDGDISGQIKLKYDGESVYYGDTGSQGIVFQVTNSAGDTVQFEAKLEILSEELYRLPYPALREYLVYTKVNVPIDASSYLSGLQSSNVINPMEDYDNPDIGYIARENIVIDDQTDYSTPGTYQIYYTFYQWNERDELQKQGTTTLYVIVEE